MDSLWCTYISHLRTQPLRLLLLWTYQCSENHYKNIYDLVVRSHFWFSLHLHCNFNTIPVSTTTLLKRYKNVFGMLGKHFIKRYYNVILCGFFNVVITCLLTLYCNVFKTFLENIFKNIFNVDITFFINIVRQCF